jgi:hypothetical protein
LVRGGCSAGAIGTHPNVHGAAVWRILPAGVAADGDGDWGSAHTDRDLWTVRIAGDRSFISFSSASSSAPFASVRLPIRNE